MGKFKQQICLAAVTAAFVIQVFAAEPVTPPFQDPQEEWVMTYDSYKSFVSIEPQYRDLSRDVYIVRDHADLYIKGIFIEYPDAWVKGVLNGTLLRIEGSQLITAEDTRDIYFRCGLAEYYWGSGNTYTYKEVIFSPDSELCNYTVSGDGNTITAPKQRASFWYSDKAEGYFMFWLRYEWPFEKGTGEPEITGTGFPVVDYMVNMKFHKKDESGIDGIGSESVDDTDVPMYDLQGRTVNPETARPGIYIRNGKKIVIR